MPVTTRSASAKANAKMRLRSGKILPGPPANQTKSKVSEDNTNKLHPVVASTIHHYKRVSQCENAEIEKSVNKAIHVLNSYVVTFHEIDYYVGIDPIMEKIRLVGMMFAYVNSLPIYTMMNDRLKSVREMMLKMCIKFSKEAKEKIDIRIKIGMEKMPERNPTQYYTAQLNDMQEQLDKFTKTYTHRA